MYGEYEPANLIRRFVERRNFFIKDGDIEAALSRSGGLSITYATETDSYVLEVERNWVTFEQMPANCGAVMISNIECGSSAAISFVAKNMASVMGDKVIFLSATQQRAPEFAKLGWVTAYTAWSGRGSGYKMHYMFYTLKEEERESSPWREDDEYDENTCPYCDDYDGCGTMCACGDYCDYNENHYCNECDNCGGMVFGYQATCDECYECSNCYVLMSNDNGKCDDCNASETEEEEE